MDLEIKSALATPAMRAAIRTALQAIDEIETTLSRMLAGAPATIAAIRELDAWLVGLGVLTTDTPHYALPTGIDDYRDLLISTCRTRLEKFAGCVRSPEGEKIHV